MLPSADLKAATTVETPPTNILGILSRLGPGLIIAGSIVGSGELWLARLRNEPPALAVWPELDLDGCAAGVTRLEERWPRHLAIVRDEDLGEGVGYRNTRGEYWTSTVADIISHVALHSSYHRGQIASELRAAGATPAYTDFIHAVRQGLVE